MEEKHTYELSHGQRRFWVQSQMDSESIALNQPVAIRIKQSVHIEYLYLALQRIIERHYILRTLFTVVNGEPRQIILEKLEIKIPEVDLSALSMEKRWAEAQKDMSTQTNKPFDLARGPLLRACIYKLAEDDYIFYICMHHIIEDGWSMDLLFQELFVIYQTLRDNVPVQLPELPIQYVDYAYWQNQLVSEGKLQKQGDYWKEKLNGELPSLNLPLDFIRPAIRSVPYSVEKIVLERETYKDLEKINYKYGTTMFMTIVACLNVLLSKLSNQDDIIVGTPIAGRNNKYYKNLIGFFVNTLVLRNQISQEIKFSDFLQQVVKKNCVEAYAHQDYPFDKLLQELNISRQLNRAPLFDVLINFASSLGDTLDFGEIKFEKIKTDDNAETNEFDLTVIVEIVNEQMVITLNYGTDIFMAETMRRIAENFRKIIKSIAKNPEQLVCEIDYLSNKELEVIRKINSTSKDYPTGCTIPSLFVKQVGETPNAACILQDGKQLTYEELHLHSNKIGNLLRDYGIQPNQMVAVMANRGVQLMAAILGILKAGGAYVPIDPEYPEKRIKYMLDDSRCQVLITEEQYLQPMTDSLPGCIETVICIDRTEESTVGIGLYRKDTCGDFSKIHMVTNISLSTSDTVLTAKEDDLAYVIYTSGSSGYPKGVMITHKAVINTLFWLQDTFHLCEHDIVAQKTSASFTDSVWEFFWTLIVGAKMTIITSDIVKDPLKLYYCLKSEKVTVTQFVPALMSIFLNVVRNEGEINPLPDLRWVFNGGEALPVNLVQEWYSIFCKAKIANIYGMTESAIYATNYIIEKKPAEGELRIPLGLPIANTHVYILNHAGQVTGFNTQGEICIGGIGITNGYWGKPDLTINAFINHPLTGEKLYRSGDLGCLRPNGMFEYLGRKDDQVQVRGFRVEMKEVERAVVSFPLIKEAAVVPYKEETGLIGLICYYTGKQPNLNPSEIRKHLKDIIPYYMIPNHLIQMEALPLTPHGKVDRKNLPGLESHNNARAEYQCPSDQVEKELATIWEEILELSNIGVLDNFFALGGHSLKMARLVYQVQEQMNIDITFKEIIENQTIQELANQIRKKTSSNIDDVEYFLDGE